MYRTKPSTTGQNIFKPYEAAQMNQKSQWTGEKHVFRIKNKFQRNTGAKVEDGLRRNNLRQDKMNRSSTVQNV